MTASNALVESFEADSTPTVTRGSALNRFLRDVPGVAAAVIVLLAAVLGLIGPLIAPFDPNAADIAAVNAPPFSPNHLLGGDGSGRDILSRLLYGAQKTLVACVIVLVVSVLVGAISGLIAGYLGGRFDAVAYWLSDAVMSMPGIVLLIALYAVVGPNEVLAMLTFGVLIAPGFFRLVRALVQGVRGELYVDAARVSGLSDTRIVGRHVLWAVRGPVIVQCSFVLGAAIGIQAAFGFLGLGDPTAPSWGTMLQESFTNIYNNGWAVLWPAGIITLMTLVFVVLGNATRDAVQPTATRSRRTLRRLRNSFASQPDLIEDSPATTPANRADAAGEPDLLRVSGLRLGYPAGDRVREVVHGIDLTVRRGEIRGLVGESGSGKSQTAFSIVGILPPEALNLGGSVCLGSVDLLSDDHARRNSRGRRIAYVPQEPMSNLDPSFTIGAQLVYGLRAVKKISRRDARRLILDLLASVGIRDPELVFRQYPHEISGGMAQRVLICGALAPEPDLIIADEPTTALDVTVQAEVLDLLRSIRDKRGIGVLLVTHNFGVVADLCDTVSVMKDGRIVESGAVEKIFHAPHHEYTRALLAATRSVDLEEERP
ncbi:dipeptide/oligopeptide/nickel ABC transporter permease/ATP-binding protein [Microbacterium sp. NPDC091313]